LEVGEGAARALLAADVDSVVEMRLGVRGEFAALKVAHHGAGSSSGAGFLAGARPRIAVISCGRHNPFGHPDDGALARLAATGARVRRTDRDGTAWIEIGPEGAGEIAWRHADLEASEILRAAPTAPAARGTL